MGESSTRIGDPLGSLCVASFFVFIIFRRYNVGCDHTSINAPDPIRTITHLGSSCVAPFLVFVFFYLNSGASTLFSSIGSVSTFHILCFCFVNLYVSHSNWEKIYLTKQSDMVWCPAQHGGAHRTFIFGCRFVDESNLGRGQMMLCDVTGPTVG